MDINKTKEISRKYYLFLTNGNINIREYDKNIDKLVEVATKKLQN